MITISARIKDEEQYKKFSLKLREQGMTFAGWLRKEIRKIADQKDKEDHK